MKHYIFTSILTLTAVVLFPQISLAQSISGNVKDLSATIDLGYANVDIYQGEELVASVLADKEGNFNVELDTGTYRAEIVYAGYKKISQQIRVKSDESVDFNLAEDKDSKYKPVKVKETVEEKADYSDYDGDGVGYFMDASPESPETITRGATTSVKPARSALMMKRSAPRGISVSRPVIPQQGVAGKLTTGEINDFSKWDLWGDLAEGEFAQYSQLWSYSVSNRYMVQLADKKGLPLADATVQLVDKEGVSYYFARTDNTGKAELWASISGRDFKKNKFSIVGNYHGESFGIRKVKTIANGINTIKLNVVCTQSQKVDIAFVVDATGSMSDELNYLTAELNDVIYKSKEISATLNFSFANVFYRDRGDAYLTQQQDFTRVLSESVSFISQQQAGGGGDFEEAVEVALDTAVNTLQWSEDARARILFLILDAPPHNTPEIHEKLKRVSRQAAEKGIRIVPLVSSGINKGTEYLMRSIALATNGTYAFLTDDSGIGGSHLKPSTDTYKVETLNDLLVRVIKSYTYMPNCEQELPDLNLNYPADSITYTPVNTTLTDTSSVVTNSTNPKDISWTYYPNPTRGIVNIKASVDIPELYITDLSGKVLQVVSNLKKQNIQRIDLSSYASGIYLIRYPIGKQWLSGKVILKR